MFVVVTATVILVAALIMCMRMAGAVSMLMGMVVTMVVVVIATIALATALVMGVGVGCTVCMLVSMVVTVRMVVVATIALAAALTMVVSVCSVRRDRDHAHGCNRRARGHGRVLLQRRGLCGGFCRHRGYAYQQVWRERRGRGALPWCRLSLGLHHQTASVLRVAAGKALLFQQGGNRR